MSDGRVIAITFYVSVLLTSLGLGLWFITTCHRFPAGQGDLLNWLLGLTAC